MLWPRARGERNSSPNQTTGRKRTVHLPLITNSSLTLPPPSMRRREPPLALKARESTLDGDWLRHATQPRPHQSRSTRIDLRTKQKGHRLRGIGAREKPAFPKGPRAASSREQCSNKESRAEAPAACGVRECSGRRPSRKAWRPREGGVTLDGTGGVRGQGCGPVHGPRAGKGCACGFTRAVRSQSKLALRAAGWLRRWRRRARVQS